ncbi:MAG: hypothetical protein KKE37_01035 [Verrucomicrobia bacterium]|nr:hypothetical protein [Verrucomicrobiota bacterium]MBU4292030.1 hypothetical protein [Verrucomicrobiota bacterium]MBU4427918.1 hypothetical protein [Verrucomicrobiota bacterium]MCG2678864.1 hypothetical protein [Kiritimatiellia bacterium]
MIFRYPISTRYSRGWRVVLFALLAGLLAGCSTPPLQTARENFHVGRFQQANQNLAAIPEDDKDAVLYLMERGMIRQALGQYDASSADWRKAAEKNDLLETYSVSQGAVSLIANDRVLSFRGAPFERTLLYAFLAKNYLAQKNWDYAAICARNIIRRLDNNDGFPDIPYGRYMAGFCMEMINDEGNAAIQYKTVSKLLPDIVVDEDTGLLYPRNLKDSRSPQTDKGWRNELICFVLIGRIPTGENPSVFPTGEAPYAELYCTNLYLGRSVPLANMADLISATTKRTAMIQMAKDATRVAVKIGISQAIKQQNEALGFLTELLLFSMEQPDTRRWETLPLWLEVARLPCPPNPTEIKVVFKDAGHHTLGTTVITTPIVRRGNLYITFCRDAGN